MNINDYKKYEPFWGKWYLSQELGKGAYGTVFEAETRDFGQMKSALKIVSIPASSTEIASYREDHFEADDESVASYFYGFVEEFLREISIMAKLKGKSNIVSIEDYEVRKHTESIGWDILIRMELLTSLNKYFAKKAITESDVVKLGIDICRALGECEKQNIIHRDIKPSNIFVSDAGEYKLGDFGVARTLEKTSSGLSKKGTYTYMAPEVYKGEEDYDATVDIYSLGIVMYKLLNNNFEPFRTAPTAIDEENAFKNRLKNEPMQKPQNASEGVANIILTACSYNAKDRYQSAQAMLVALEAVAADNSPLINTQKASLTAPVSEEDGATQGLFSKDCEQTQGLFSVDATPKEQKKAEIKPPVAKTKKAKNKYIALILAFLPYNIFGLYRFYMYGAKQGLLRLFTFNFLMVGYFIDWFDAINYCIKSSKTNKKTNCLESGGKSGYKLL